MSAQIRESVVIQPDGKIVAAGYGGLSNSTRKFALARFNNDGSLDTTFGDDGLVVTSMLPSGTSGVISLALLPDGRIVAGGRTFEGTNTSFAVALYNADGSLDPSFDGDGKVVTQIISRDNLNQIKVQSDGKILAAGSTYNGSNTDIALVRYNIDGSLDPGYGTGGKAVIDLGFNESASGGLALDAAERAIVTGRGGLDTLAARILSDLESQQVDVGGRVTSTNGQGIFNATVVLRDANNNRRFALTNAFGYFVFSGVATLESYVVSVSSKRYRFQPSSQTITLMGSVSNVDFVGNPGSESKMPITGGEKKDNEQIGTIQETLIGKRP